MTDAGDAGEVFPWARALREDVGEEGSLPGWGEQVGGGGGQSAGSGAAPAGTPCYLSSGAERPQESAGPPSLGWIPASTSPSKSESERQEQGEPLWQSCLPRGAEPREGRVSPSLLSESPHPPAALKGVLPALSDPPHGCAPTARLGSCGPCTPSGVLREFTGTSSLCPRAIRLEGQGVCPPPLLSPV